jgi:hypothetical protein
MKRLFDSALYTDQPYTVETCNVVSQRLVKAIEYLEAAGIRVDPSGRLWSAVRLLRRIALEGQYPPNAEQLYLISWALRDALDYPQIIQGYGLDTLKLKPVQSEFRHAIGGNLNVPRSMDTPLTYQVQLWVGAILAHANLAPVIPQLKTRSPDFLVENGSLRHGIEVKRPSSVRSFRNFISNAAHQLDDARVRGALVIDVSNLLDGFGLFHASERGEGNQFLDTRFLALATQFSKTLTAEMNSCGSSSHLRSIFLLVVLARGFHWNLSDLSTPELYANGVFSIVSRRGNLWWCRGEWLRNAFMRGLRNLGGMRIEQLS